MLILKNGRKSPAQFLCWALLCILSWNPCITMAQGGFSGGMTPSRFEIKAEAGKVLKRTFSIYNVGDRPTQFGVSTVEWALSTEGNLSFQDALKADSCRPWVRLERHKVNVMPSATKPRMFRFEMHIPKDAPAQECRFALMVSSLGDPYTATLNEGNISIPVAGRIAVIVYVAIGDVSSDLLLKEVKVVQRRGDWMPVVRVHKKGKAHGRLDGDFTGVDASGEKFNMFVATAPIMPGQTKEMLLSLGEDYRAREYKIVYPLRLTGKVYADEQIFDLNTTVEAPDNATE